MPDWEHPDTVAFFRARDPDVGVMRFIDSGGLRPGAHVLDLGCAAGRNAVFLAERGFPGVAVDASAAMVATTRERLAPFAATAPWRVLQRPMSELDDLEAGSFALLLALGVLQNAPNEAMFTRTLAHLARLATDDAHLFVQNFGPDSRPHGEPLRRVDGTRHVWTGFSADDPDLRYTLPDPAALDGLVAHHGFLSATPTRVVRKSVKGGERSTIIADYRRPKPRRASLRP